MKVRHVIRDIIVSLISLCGLAYIYRVIARKNGPLVRVVCFHDIPDKAWFESVISLINSEHNVISPEDFFYNKLSDAKINVLLTFDDGYKSWVNIVLPVLSRWDNRGIFFLSSGLVDIAEKEQDSDRFIRERLNIIFPPPALNWCDAKRVLSCGHIVGGHTRTHPNLVDLPLESQKEEIVSDILSLKKNLNTAINCFAYPFGTSHHTSSVTTKLAKQIGLQFVFSAMPGFCNSQDELISRTLLRPGQSISSIRKWVTGSYDIFYMFTKKWL